jgi:hypothetical protein
MSFTILTISSLFVFSFSSVSKAVFEFPLKTVLMLLFRIFPCCLATTLLLGLDLLLLSQLSFISVGLLFLFKFI